MSCKGLIVPHYSGDDNKDAGRHRTDMSSPRLSHPVEQHFPLRNFSLLPASQPQ